MYPPNSAPGLASNRLYEKCGVRSLLVFFSHRVVRSGPRVLLYLAIFITVVVVICRGFSLNVADFSIITKTGGQLWRQQLGAAASSASKVWGSSSNSHSGSSSTGGGLRVVVFGENDVTTSIMKPIPGIEVVGNNNTWTTELCAELDCTTYMSFVPLLDQPRISLTSNARYRVALDSVVSKPEEERPAGYNYTFLPRDYPPRWEAPDLNEQVAAFINQPRPKVPPRETLWVFSFGFWDVWSLAAFPLDVAETMVSALAADVFDCVETLYLASQDPTSIAFSDYTSSAKESPLPWNDTESEPFRILLPLVLDPTVIPGWRSVRPLTQSLHHEVEQVRNAVKLTKQWNDAIVFQVETWERRNPQPAAEEAEQEGDGNQDKDNGGQSDEEPKMGFQLDARSVDKKRRTGYLTPLPSDPAVTPAAKVGHSGKKMFGSGKKEETTTKKTRTLWRDAIVFRPSEYIMDVLIDGQLHATGSMDKLGFGAFSNADRFSQVYKPCIAPTAVRRPLPQVNIKANTSVSVTDAVAKNGPPPMGTVFLACDSPDDHLFYTSVSLNERAISEIGKLGAAVAQMTKAARDKWEQTIKTKMSFDRLPESWKMIIDLAR